MTQDSAIAHEETRLRRIALASAIGTTIEWYDFFLYGVLATLVLNRVFFPGFSPLLGTLLSYTTFAIGFVARPVGGIIFGHFGDRIGRKTVLILTLLIMGISTFLIGLLPGYATLGVAAPILLLLLRIIQGIGIGGEWGGAVVLAIEHAPAGRRGYFGAYPQIGVPAGLMSSAAVVAILTQLPDGQFMLWGWRIAFLLSALLVAVGLFIRLKIMETPEFLAVQATKTESRVPLFDMFRFYPRAILLTLGARYIEGACFNMFGVFIISYAVGTLHLSRGFTLGGVIIASAVMIPFILIFGALADRIGLKRMFGTGALIVALTSVGAFAVMQTYGAVHPILVWVSIIVPLSLAYPMVYGPESSLFASQFETRVRYTGVSFAYQFSGIFASGLTPIVATLLLAADHGRPWYIAWYMVAVGLISFVSVTAMRIPETAAAHEAASPIMQAATQGLESN
ncbi:MFS transporter [Acidiphilium iwatense]|uniref:MHS family MFS transporter n=1 Tax=Acidiphilium iwatense TaxID=768198 RepID=A0ABS9DW32_9PROT|nr:MFS transporter [Acidiphilium iwatense]MCF3946899.1 MHS family MFS transporter [Acidiphilium iwatense]